MQLEKKPLYKLKNGSFNKIIWKEFEKIKAPDDAPPGEREPSGKSKECGRILKMKNSSTGALRSHLKCHKGILARVVASELPETEQEDANSPELHKLCLMWTNMKRTVTVRKFKIQAGLVMYDLLI